MRTALLLTALLAHPTLALAIELSPKKIGGGMIPAGHTVVVFTTSDGNWTRNVTLPQTGLDGARIKVVVKSTYAVTVLNTNTEMPAGYRVGTGESVRFQYSSRRNLWEVESPTVSGSNTGTPLNIQIGSRPFIRAVLSNQGWAPRVVLPAKAEHGATVFASSTSSKDSVIDPAHLQFPYTAPLRAGDRYTFTFNAKTQKWGLVEGPVTQLSIQHIQSGIPLPTPTTAVTKLTLPAASVATKVVLPATANDRDQVIIQSHASDRSTIEAGNQPLGSLTVGNGDSYRFMWNGGRKEWALLRAPVRELKAGSLPTKGVVPTPETPVTVIEAWNSNVADPLILPATAQTNDRVVVKSSATASFRVTAAGMDAQTVTTGEEVAFVFGANKVWSRETDTLRLLLVSSAGAIQKLGLSGAQARQQESVRKTNEALANSGATFRFQPVGFLSTPNLGGKLNEALPALRKSQSVLAERDRLKAASVYYEGVERGCGLAYVNTGGSRNWMFATGSLACGTDVMRHELGHAMGLGHGNGVADTVMSGNALPYFATPHRYAKTLLHLGHGAKVPDEVSVLNKNAERLLSAK